MTDTRNSLADLIEAASNYVKPRRATDARQRLLESLDAARAALVAQPARATTDEEVTSTAAIAAAIKGL